MASLKGVKRIWAHFSYQTQPGAELPITIAWYAPNGRLVGSAHEPNRPEVGSLVGSTAAAAQRHLARRSPVRHHGRQEHRGAGDLTATSANAGNVTSRDRGF